MCNTRGLTDLGRYAVGRLIDEHMLIEADHMSEIAREQVLTIAEQRHYAGVISSHTGTGGAWDPSELSRLYALGGFASATIDGAAALIKKVLAFRAYGTAATPGLGDRRRRIRRDARAGAGRQAAAAALSVPRLQGKGEVHARAHGQPDLRPEQGRRRPLRADPDLLADAQRRAGGRRALGMLFHSAGAYVRTWRHAGG